MRTSTIATLRRKAHCRLCDSLVTAAPVAHSAELPAPARSPRRAMPQPRTRRAARPTGGATAHPADLPWRGQRTSLQQRRRRATRRRRACCAPERCARPCGNDHGSQVEGRARGLVKEYRGLKALDGVSLTVSSGGVLGVLGANGAGKTTLIRCRLGLVEATAGMVTLFGAPPTVPVRRTAASLSRRLHV